MSNYFSYFPTTPHDITNNGQVVYLTNILRRFKVKSSVREDVGLYYDYEIQPGDRPDIIAAKYYGSADYSWVVLLYNEIVDPVYGWPLFNQDFDDYIKVKYGSERVALETIHEYRKILQQPIVNYDGSKIEKRYVVVDVDTYNNTPANERESVTKLEYEESLNEEKRKIRLLDKKYLTKLRNEVKTILSDN